MTTQTVQLKAGATFSYAGTVTLPAGTWSAAAKVKDPAGAVVQSLTVTLGSPTGQVYPILLEATAAQTLLWPINQLRCDVKFTDSSVTPVKIPSETFLIDVEEGIT